MNVVAFNPAAEDAAPHSVEAEQQLLGALLLDPERIPLVASQGGARLFYDPVHRDLYEAIAQRDRDGLLISPVALKEWAEAHEGASQIGGPSYLARLASAAAYGDLREYCDLLGDLAAKRDLLEAVSAARERIAEDPAHVVAGRLEAALATLDGGGKAPRPVSMTAAVTDALREIVAAHRGDETRALRTGIGALDAIFSGLFPGELVLLGGRPSMGKTSAALNIALNVARQGHGVVIASYEMTPESMAMRALSEGTAEAGNAMAYSDMRRGDVADMAALRDAARGVGELPITFLPRAFSETGALFAGAKQARRILGQENMRLLIVDYVQLMRAAGRSRYEQITEISQALKSLAGQLGVPVLALSQLSRQVESRDDKRPRLDDLRESGQLEQDADAVLFCYRDEYYLERTQPPDHDLDAMAAWQDAMERAKNRLEIICAKQRQGRIGTAHVFCNPAFNRIWEPGA